MAVGSDGEIGSVVDRDDLDLDLGLELDFDLGLSLGPPEDLVEEFARARLDELDLSPGMMPTADRIVESEAGRKRKRRARCQRAELTT